LILTAAKLPPGERAVPLPDNLRAPGEIVTRLGVVDRRTFGSMLAVEMIFYEKPTVLV
jgi:hypothetical protein